MKVELLCFSVTVKKPENVCPWLLRFALEVKAEKVSPFLSVFPSLLFLLSRLSLLSPSPALSCFCRCPCLVFGPFSSACPCVSPSTFHPAINLCMKTCRNILFSRIWDRQTERRRDGDTERQTDRQTDRQPGRQTDRQTDRHGQVSLFLSLSLSLCLCLSPSFFIYIYIYINKSLSIYYFLFCFLMCCYVFLCVASSQKCKNHGQIFPEFSFFLHSLEHKSYQPFAIAHVGRLCISISKLAPCISGGCLSLSAGTITPRLLYKV